MRIHDVHDFNARRAARELLDALGSAGDKIDRRVEEGMTRFGPIFVFWNGEGGVLETAREFVRAECPFPDEAT